MKSAKPVCEERSPPEICRGENLSCTLELFVHFGVLRLLREGCPAQRHDKRTKPLSRSNMTKGIQRKGFDSLHQLTMVDIVLFYVFPPAVLKF